MNNNDIRASREGIKRINDSYKKRFHSIHHLICDANNHLLTIKTPSKKKYMVTEYQLNKFRGGEYINLDLAKAICKSLHIDITEIIVCENTNGLNNSPRKNNIFNDYKGQRCLDEIWVDPVPMRHEGTENGYMNIHVESNIEESNDYIKILFKRQGWGCNFTLRPADESPLIAHSFTRFSFNLRSALGHKIGVRVRITDARDIIWCYGKLITHQGDLPGNFSLPVIPDHVEEGIYNHKNLHANSMEWKKIVIHLNTDEWFNFKHDGRTPIGEAKPDRSIIKLITFDVGFEDSNENDNYCHSTKFSCQDIRHGELHLSPIIFE
jgi:DNA-binding Xre family transcriptional regulator